MTDYDEIDEEFEAAMEAEARAIEELNGTILAAARRWLVDARDDHVSGGFGTLDLACAEIAACGAEIRWGLSVDGMKAGEIFAIFDRLRVAVAEVTAVLDANTSQQPKLRLVDDDEGDQK
jgi:hypothetical protein